MFGSQNKILKPTDFHDKKIIKLGLNHTWLEVISLDSALKKNGNCYLQVFLKECKTLRKKNKWDNC